MILAIYSGWVLGVVATALGGPEVLQVTELPEPVADRGVVVVTRPTAAIVPARGVRQELQLIRHDRALLADLMGQVATGQLRTRVAATLPLTEAADAIGGCWPAGCAENSC